MIDEVVVPSKGLNAFSNFRQGDTSGEADNMRQQGSVLSIFAFTDKKHLTILLPAIFLTFIAGAIKPIITILLGRIFDELISFDSGDINEQELLNSVSKWCVALTGLGVATMVVNGGFFSLWLVFGEMQARSVRNKAFQSMIRKETDWYEYHADGIGSFLVRIQTQIRELQTASSQPFGFCIEDAAAALAALGIAFYYSWNLTLVILGFVPLTVMLLAVITRKLKPAIENQKRDLSEASKYSYIAIRAVDVVKVFNGQDLEILQYTCAIKKATKSYLVQANTNSLQIGIMRFMTTAMFVVGFWYGIVLFRKGLDSGSVLTTFYSCLMATQAAEGLLPQWLVLAKGMSAGEALKENFLQLDYGRNISKMAGTIVPTTCHGDVELSKLSVIKASKVHCSSLFGLQVTFLYPSNIRQNAIENASFFFPAGEMTFVVGRSGSGKSTLGNLLTSFYQPSSGTILIDDQSIQTLDLTWLRRNIFCVQQESILFNETLSRNIAFGRRPYMSATEDDIQTASQIAMLQQTTNDLPEGLQTNIGSRGDLLSGGQRQRVAIARARLHDAQILILDEATSALDRKCKTLVMDAIRGWRHGKTTIVITHDISEIKEKDYVYVLEKGKVVQEGYRKQLLEQEKGLFASFESLSHVDSENQFSDNAVVPSLDNSAHMPYERSISHASASSGDEWLRTDHQNRSRIQRVSCFFGLDEQLSRNGQVSNQRVRRGVGMSSIFANTLQVKDTWQSRSVPSIPRPLHSSMSKPLPALPIQSQARQSSRSDRTISDDKSLEIELIHMSGSSAAKNRLQTGELRRNARRSGIMGPDANTTTPLAIGRKSYGRRNTASIPPRSHHVEASMSSILGTLWPNLNSRDRITLILGFANAFISASATPAFSYVLARLLGTFGLGSEQAAAAKTWALAILAIAAADGISSYYMHYLLEYCSQTWISTLRVEALKRILAQPKAWFDKPENNPGRLNECLDRDAEEMRNIVGRFAGYVFLAGSMVSIAIVWAFIICWKLTLVSLASGPCMFAFTRAFEMVSGKWEKKLNEMADAAGDIFAETFSKIKTVRALSLESYFEEKYSKATAAAYQVGLRRAVYTSIFFGISDSTNLFVTALILYYSTVIAASGAWSINSILQVITLLLFSSGNANAAIAFIPQISASRAAASQLLHLAHMPRTAPHNPQGRTRLRTPLPIHLTSLSFSYPCNPARKVLHNLSMTIPANTCTAIVGPSGSGKSTIASLLLALRPPSSLSSSSSSSPLLFTDPLHTTATATASTTTTTTTTTTTPPLTFHHTPISHLDIPALRAHIALVPQDPFLFPATIAANITYGLPPHSPLRTTHNLQCAARAVGIHDFIMGLPHGYNTHIGGGGGDGDDGGGGGSSSSRGAGSGSSSGSGAGGSMGLSGGQAQRLCIARALVRRPRVLVLDEPTSALDAESARVVRGMIAGLVSGGDGVAGAGVAVVLITHSVPMMRVAGRIVVLEGGRVVQEGSYAELVRERGGAFVRLVSGEGAS